MILLALFVILLFLVAIGFPVILAIGSVGLAGILISPDLTAPLFSQKLFTALDSFSLLAMPYFILAGVLMARGGLAASVIEFAETVVGHIRGYLAHTTVLSCMAMANISGSSTAEAAAIGSIVIPEMKKRGYKPGFAASVVGTAATIGPIIPPSMTMIIYGSMTGVSIGGLFLGGILPGILIGVALITLVFVMSFFPGYPELRSVKPRASLRNMLRAARGVWVALLAPVIVLGGILSGVFTATEAGVVASIYAFVISFFVYKSITLRDLYSILLEAAVTTAMVVGIISMSGALGWLLAYMDFNELVLRLIRGISDHPTVVLLTLLASMLVMTMFIESLAVLIVLVPVIAYVGNIFGFDPFHLGIVTVIATQIGATTPPVAVLLFVATSVAECRFGETVRYCWPFVLTLLLSLMVLVFVPELSTWLPHRFLG